MKKKVKFSIVVSLVIVIGVVIALKQSTSSTNSPDTYSQSNRQTSQQPADVNLTPKQKFLPRLVDLGAGKCIPCKLMAPMLEELKAEYSGQLEVVFIDVSKNPDEAKKYGIRIIPTQIFFDASGKEFFRHEGFFSKEDILNRWKEFGLTFEKGTQNESN